VLDVRRWAEIRRMREVEGLSIDEIVRRTGHDRNTVRRALRREDPPRYQRPPQPSKLAFKDEIHRLLRDDARIPGKRVRELIEELGYEGSKTILGLFAELKLRILDGAVCRCRHAFGLVDAAALVGSAWLCGQSADRARRRSVRRNRSSRWSVGRR
jgi:transposase